MEYRVIVSTSKIAKSMTEEGIAVKGKGLYKCK